MLSKVRYLDPYCTLACNFGRIEHHISAALNACLICERSYIHEVYIQGQVELKPLQMPFNKTSEMVLMNWCLFVVEHGGAVHGSASVPCAELVKPIKNWTVITHIEVI